ncbi:MULTISPECIES: hypothetical protein [unclassified Arsenophonus]|uniref:hypothetical protein n=1 Tax=unclassified Arsenophonus TaxID=2627083 RepID=UPI00285C8272|nr:hypothetical protein [Arsenophonus sp.]MDR5611367.1 hypothetical protein [Arsenophonus sp.]
MSMTNVDFIRPEYNLFTLQWGLVRTVCRGGEDIKSYLPTLEESDENRKKKRNKDYQERAVFYPITGNTRNGMIGISWRLMKGLLILKRMLMERAPVFIN